MQKMSGIWQLTITRIDIFLIFTPANPDHIYHFVEDLGGRKLWYTPDPLLLWGNGILRTLALASGSTSFSGLDADHHIQLIYRFFYFINHWANWFSVMAFITQYGGTISLFHCIEHLSSILYPLLYRVQTLAETLSGL